MINLDKIIVLHCLEHKERYNNIVKELNDMDLLYKSYISEFVQLNINVTIGNKMDSIHTPYYNSFVKYYNMHDLYGNVFSCSYNWLLLISQAYHKGYNNILCLEDDIMFNCNKHEFYEHFNNMPKDTNICFFCVNESTGYPLLVENEIKNNCDKEYLLYHKDLHFYGTQAIYMDRIGMKYYIDYMEKNFTCADALYTINSESFRNELNVYYSTKCYITHEISKFKSTILI